MSQLNLIGQTLGHFEILSELGRGGMGVVYQARQLNLNRIAAVKVLLPELTHDANYVARFHREAQNAARLEHPSIIPIYEVGQAGTDLHYIAMRYIKGETLRDVMLREQVMSVHRAIELLTPIASALDYAHQHGVIHRDIKPQNVMITSDGAMYLADFGLARNMSETSGLTVTGMVMGTPEYMSPEQAQGLPTIGPSTDIYALGVILYQMVTGTLPFEAETPMALMAARIFHSPRPPGDVVRGLSPAVENIIMRTLARNPDMRPTSAGEIITALRSAAGTPPGREPLPEAEFKTTVVVPSHASPSGSPLGAVPPVPISQPSAPPVTPPAAAPTRPPTRKKGNIGLMLGLGAGGCTLVLVLLCVGLAVLGQIGENNRNGGTGQNERTPTATLPATTAAPPTETLSPGRVLGAYDQTVRPTVPVATEEVFPVVPTARPTVTARPTSQPTTASRPTATAFPTPPPLPPSPSELNAQLVASDDFVDNRNGWFTGEFSGNTIGTQAIRGGVLVMTFREGSIGNYEVWETRLQNFMAQVDMAVMTTGAFGGLSFGIQDESNSYGAYLSPDEEYYILRKWQNNEGVLMAGEEHPAIKPGNATNRILVIRQGARMQFYVNDVLVIEYEDDAFLAGKVGLTAFPGDAGDAEVWFDNFRLWRLP
ncbi:MAG: protein kinase [Chloroflexaceae bacterium]|nr:protein kinase [Chloroflexaceae bacterium]